jgi:hypothetical protein
MFECPANAAPEQGNGQQNFGFLTRQFPAEHKNLVAKKFWVKKVSDDHVEVVLQLIFDQLQSMPATNPYLEGPKLPVAAKKGFNVN